MAVSLWLRCPTSKGWGLGKVVQLCSCAAVLCPTTTLYGGVGVGWAQGPPQREQGVRGCAAWASLLPNRLPQCTDGSRGARRTSRWPNRKTRALKGASRISHSKVSWAPVCDARGGGPNPDTTERRNVSGSPLQSDSLLSRSHETVRLKQVNIR